MTNKGGCHDLQQLIEKSKHCDYLEDLCARQAKEIERLNHEIRLLKFEEAMESVGWKSAK